MIFTLFGILITSVGISPAFGENGIIVVSTDKPSYSDGDIITISGEIKNMVPGDQLSILIQSPNGNLVALDQLTVSSDNQFSTEIKLGGKLMKTEGTYTIKVQYREQSATTYFDFDGVKTLPTNELDKMIVEDNVVQDVIISSKSTSSPSTSTKNSSSPPLIDASRTDLGIVNVIEPSSVVSM